MSTEEVSGTGYQRRDITWTTATVEGSVLDFERLEAERWLESLWKFAGLFEDEDEE